MQPGRTEPPAWVERLQALAARLFGSGRVVRARAVIDRYNAAGGGLLAAGIAYNTLFALIPMAVFASGVIGVLLTDRAARTAASALLIGWAPPLAGVADEIVRGLASASPSLSLLGLAGMAWGSSRLFASLELGIWAMFAGVPRPGLVVRTIRRLVSIAVVAGLVLVAIASSTVASLVAEINVAAHPTVAGVVIEVVSLLLPLVAAGVALAIVYRLVPPARPDRRAVVRPAVVAAVVLVAVTRLFAILAPRLLGANFVLGTLGAVFVGLAWLALAYAVILLGAAWVRERMLDREVTAAVA